VWAIQGISFSLGPGDSLALLGNNGSGKSTMLRLVAGVMYPYAGDVRASGQIGALIEVAGGLHPELTGRENIFLYGSLLGLRRKEVAKRFDAIVDFAELSDALERQVKYYSSGMKMRLGFSVAAFLEPDVFLVDEVLSVGDASFQQKCLDRMRDVLAKGTTLLFVSHDLAAVEATCANAIWVQDGRPIMEGPSREVVAAYRHSTEEHTVHESGPHDPIHVVSTVISGDGPSVVSHESFDVEVVLESELREVMTVHLGVSEGTATPIFLVRKDFDLKPGATKISCRIESAPLANGRYTLWITVADRKGRQVLTWRPTLNFDVLGPRLDAPPRAVMRLAPVHVEAKWEIGT
jgi:ABC-2 type transport system ATP-binding protein